MLDDKTLHDWIEGIISEETLLRQIEGDQEAIESYKEYKKLLEGTSNLTIRKTKNKELVWNKLQIERSKPPTETKVIRFSALLKWAAAASILFAVSISVYIYSGTSLLTYQTNLAETENIELPDGSIITLNAESTLKFDPKSWSKNRFVQLEGEAFFKVQKGSSFRVEAPNGKVQVLGTSFNVYSRNADFKVTCFTGKVEVKSNESSVILKKGKSTQLIENILVSPFQINESTTATWRVGKFYCENMSANEILEIVKRQYGVEIEHKSIEEPLTLSFDNQDLEESLQVICVPLGLKFEIKGKKVVIFN